jgi:hypothetical protein
MNIQVKNGKFNDILCLDTAGNAVGDGEYEGELVSVASVINEWNEHTWGVSINDLSKFESIYRVHPIKQGLDLEKLEADTDKFISEQTGESYGKMFKETDDGNERGEHLTSENHKQLKRPEFIICSAIHYDDGIEYPHQAKNIHTGLVICGRRHHNCITNASLMLGDKYNKNLANRAAQGFMTSEDRYVNRKEAFRIALAQKQIIHNFYDENNADQILCSEDLY